MFTDYENSLNVLNEGFFDFVGKLIKRVFHSLFKATKYEDLLKRVNSLENIIKYGNGLNESNNIKVTHNINENRRRRRLDEDDDNATQTPIELNTTDDAPIEGNIKSTNVNMSKVNINIPSFPATAKRLLQSLGKELGGLKKMVDLDKIDDNIKAVRNGAKLSPQYIQNLEIITTNFLRKYSKGGLSLPKPSSDQPLSQSELKQWNNLLKSIDDGKYNKNDEDAFKTVNEAMMKVVELYKQEFEATLKGFNERDDKAAEDNKSTNDIKFKTEWNTKLNFAMETVAKNCIDFIPTAINDYFINSEEYKETLQYIAKMLELLYAATEVKSNYTNIFTMIQEGLKNKTIDINVLNRIKDGALQNDIDADKLKSIDDYKRLFNEAIHEDKFPKHFKNNKEHIDINDIEDDSLFDSFIDGLSSSDKYSEIYALLILIKAVDSNFNYTLEISDGNGNIKKIIF